MKKQKGGGLSPLSLRAAEYLLTIQWIYRNDRWGFSERLYFWEGQSICLNLVFG
jgi:hypothetical protein